MEVAAVGYTILDQESVERGVGICRFNVINYGLQGRVTALLITYVEYI